ncbi:protein tyrosine phosphatase [Clostridium sp. 19966]|uniref:tyrosine-protein phosphatase n=1 Tax=Clostridium sp. 19966 TaxID=2768166 RepID=UPI0028DE2911|nr:CpsB/CapC family capsule biosynthesis tyrosine phosphatase [Clostridium sp. 19966]MDT8716513.1 protein tyrosine phosphatase [Clostridium sp. 19966]
MIDFHSHIIPAVDDGSKDIDMTMNMLENSIKEGTEIICATPHFIYGECETSFEDYNTKLNQILGRCSSNIKVVSGVEVYINPELPTLFKENKIWGLNNNKYILIELPMEQFPIYTEKVFYDLRLLGLVPVLAHPERNMAIHKNIELLINLIEQGNLAQMNSGSLMGLYGGEIKRQAEKLVHMNLIHMLGSDAHNDGKRNTYLSEAYFKVKELNEQLYNWICDNENNIISGLDVECLNIKEITKNKKSFWSIFKK